MSFIEREKDIINEMIRNTPEGSEAYQPLHAAQQALAWASEPNGYSSPSATINKFYGIKVPEPELNVPDDVIKG